MEVSYKNVSEGFVANAQADFDHGVVIATESPFLLWDDLGKQTKEDTSWLNYLHKFAAFPSAARERCFTSFCLLEKDRWKLFPKVAALQEHALNSLGSEEFEGPSVDEDLLTKALLVRNSNSMVTSTGKEALYLQCSKLNHSCAPNTRFAIGEDGKCVLTAIGEIKQGDELCLSYLGQDRLLQSTRQRRFYLRNNYFFDCDCRRCVADDLCRVILCPLCKQSTAVCLGKTITASAASSADRFRCEECRKEFSSVDMLSLIQQEVELETLAAKLGRAVSGQGNYDGVSAYVSQLRELLARCKLVLGSKHWATCTVAKALGQSLSLLCNQSSNSAVSVQLVNERQEAVQMWVNFVKNAFEIYSPHAARILIEL